MRTSPPKPKLCHNKPWRRTNVVSREPRPDNVELSRNSRPTRPCESGRCSPRRPCASRGSDYHGPQCADGETCRRAIDDDQDQRTAPAPASAAAQTGSQTGPGKETGRRSRAKGRANTGRCAARRTSGAVASAGFQSGGYRNLGLFGGRIDGNGHRGRRNRRGCRRRRICGLFALHRCAPHSQP
jgi:hypothetical protein